MRNQAALSELLSLPPVRTLIDLALWEDLHGGDVTSQVTIPVKHRSEAVLLAREEMVVCGLELAGEVFRSVDPRLVFELLVDDGDEVEGQTPAASIRGSTRSILSAERTALNFVQRLSGVSTFTHRCSQEISGTGAVLVDTRKTTPGWRLLERYAVRCGGGMNHRFDLSAGVLIKDNHIQAVGSVGEAVRRAVRCAPHQLRIEVELTSPSQVAEALEAGAEVLLLDNMSHEQVAEAAKVAGGRALLEVSGGLGPGRLLPYALAGADILSIGALTHSAPAVDLSLELVPMS